MVGNVHLKIASRKDKHVDLQIVIEQSGMGEGIAEWFPRGFQVNSSGPKARLLFLLKLWPETNHVSFLRVIYLISAVSTVAPDASFAQVAVDTAVNVTLLSVIFA